VNLGKVYRHKLSGHLIKLTAVTVNVHLEHNTVVHQVELTFKLVGEHAYLPQRTRTSKRLYEGANDPVNTYLEELLSLPYPSQADQA